ncbi:hypothetical protein HPB52_000444 [Rhipicephalus sanguineus]|uniref:Uncharacterized protein n=1 Tax=Rhipicephalus sanguineus TaxID=34632 RepID=A0A9D4PFM7_RHISA|nr:hypothetical protein HPB52_000444 [Rhipicephalus sanguineus]
MSDTAGYDESCTDQWKDQLDMDKLCGPVSSQETCWLCENFTAWNQVMSALGLGLEESMPGMLLLRCSFDVKAESERLATTRQASFLASWLLFHHPCIQELIFVAIDGSDEERTSLAQQLLADNSYDRVRLGPWTEPYLRVLSPVLASCRSSVEQIFLPDIGELSLDSVTVLCNALASCKRVKHLIVAVRQEPDARVALLCDTLKNNRYIERLNIEIENADSAKEILCALTVNAAVTFLDITLRVTANEESTKAFSDMLSRNDAITSMSVWLEGEDAQHFLDSIAKAMARNKFIVSFISRVDCRIYVPYSILESVRRNKCSLNRAVERRVDRRGAECFELFVGRPCMMSQVSEVAGITDEEARLKVVAAEHLLREKYFVLTGIVRSSVVCWPAVATQIDALNSDCWQAIARYLRLNDVCFQ